MLEWFKSPQTVRPPSQGWLRGFTADGVVVAQTSGLTAGAMPLSSVELPPLLKQLEDDGLAMVVGGSWVLTWDNVFALRASPVYREAEAVISLPSVSAYAPVLESTGSLTDENFSIRVAAWHDGHGRRIPSPETCGAVVKEGAEWKLMTPQVWSVVSQVAEFSKRRARPDSGDHRRAWARIRDAALAANARLDDFLFRTVVLSPEKLEMGLRRTEVGGSTVIEVAPSFKAAPEGWLLTFDQLQTVPERYDIPTRDGIVQVLVTPEVRTVLEQIKRMPGRRVAGSRAEAFIANPFAALGDAASKAIDVEQFERERERAGVIADTFAAYVETDPFGYPEKIGISITSTVSGQSADEIFIFESDGQLKQFVELVEAKARAGMQFCGWQGYDFELMGNTADEVMKLRTAYETKLKPRVLISHAEVYDLGRYAERIQGIGQEKPYYSPFITKKDDEEGWIPDNVVPVICWTPEGQADPLALPVTKQVDKLIRDHLEAAKQAGHTALQIPGLERPLAVAEAELILHTFDEALRDVKAGRFDPAKRSEQRKHGSASRLIGRANIQSLDYEEARRGRLLATPLQARRPGGLKTDVRLKDHQLAGLAWLQHLYRSSPADCRGAVLADDMGLGKTLQLLCLIASVLEEDKSAPPALVVAPLSLLENWVEEVSRFFRDGALRVLTAYGKGIAPLKLRREQIDERLRGEGLVNFLRPGWRGDAHIVLTTYETLRDLEFSFAAERWSILVCDEAQRIKNPNALVTRAAKKQNVRFRVACTGTPVENTLADLWCLYDFVQPGLLGALNEFGRRYRKPIEAATDEEKQRVEELREKIKPQILRRMKEDVAKDLPRKSMVADCRRLKLSNQQRALYSHAIDLFRRRSQPGAVTPFKNHLGLLHYLRLICTDPRRVGLDVFVPEPLPEYRQKTPKLEWLLSALSAIKSRGEKAIIFCEFRNIQRLLAHYVNAVFGFEPDIINGDTVASATHVESRQKRIRAFQAEPGFGVLILSPLAVGFGVNIQGANHVIHYTRTWNPAKEDQATDRAYRIGQTRDVYVYCPVVCADDFTTFDQKLDELLERKRELARDMLNGAGDVAPSDFDITDVMPGGDPICGENITIEDAKQMRWDYFECLLAAICRRHGCERVYRTPATDDGVDVVAISGRSGRLIQCKASGSVNGSLGWDAVKEVVAGAASYEARHPGVTFDKVCVTNQFFNSTAIRHAELNRVQLIDQQKLAELLVECPVSMTDVEKFLYSDWQSSG